MISDEPEKYISMSNFPGIPKVNPKWCEWADKEIAILRCQDALKDKRIKELEAQSHGTRQHVKEVNQDG